MKLSYQFLKIFPGVEGFLRLWVELQGLGPCFASTVGQPRLESRTSIIQRLYYKILEFVWWCHAGSNLVYLYSLDSSTHHLHDSKNCGYCRLFVLRMSHVAGPEHTPRMTLNFLVLQGECFKSAQTSRGLSLLDAAFDFLVFSHYFVKQDVSDLKIVGSNHWLNTEYWLDMTQ